MAQPDSNTTETAKTDRDTILQILMDGMQDLRADIEGTHPVNPEEEQLQLRRYHELGYLANQHRKLSRDTDINEIDERLGFLEEDLGQ